MKAQWISIALIVTSSVAFASTSAVEQVKSKIKFTEGAYDLRSKDKACEEGYVDLELVGNEDIATLRLGQKVTFGGLEKPSSHEEAEQGCTVDYTNKFGDNEINQVIKYECPKNKSANYTKTQKIQFSGADLTYSSKTEGSAKKQVTCKYALAPGKKESR